jgi:hypothetical protein
MLRFTKSICGLAMLCLSVQWAFAYSLIGPFEAYQVPVITYQVGGDLGGPKNLGEEYRRNTPVLYYTFDANFLDYFGSNGVYAVERAFEIMNGLTNVSSYSSDLSEFPLETQAHNFQADALGLLDLKSATLNLLMEQMGLAEPDRYTWTLHDRLPGPACPVTAAYTVIKRNFDPVFSSTDQLQPTSYVNGTLYSYFIQEFCSGTPFLADAVEFPVDPLASTFTAVASFGIDFGGFYNGLTRDDVGGLRYLLRTNNMNIEEAGSNVLTFITNTVSELLFTSNLAEFVSQSLTNDAATLLDLYPDLVISSETPIFTNLVSTNVSFYFTNFPFSPAGSPASLAFVTNRTTNVVTWFNRTFANVITNSYFTRGFITILQSNIAPCPLAPAGTLCTNVTANTVVRSFINGDYFILPTNVCEFAILSTQLTSVLNTTNATVVATNATGTTNLNGQQFSQSLVFHFTNHVYVARRITCPTDAVALRQGIERVRFVRRDFDSLLNRFFYPITNDYTLNAITNNVLIPQRARRVVTTPDFLITAQDLATDPGDPNLGAAFGARNLRFNTNNAYPGLYGPGTIITPTVFTFDKVGPIYINPGIFFIGPVVPYDETTQELLFYFGSFDGTTNAPVVYPNGTDIRNLENQVLIQISPDSLPDGERGVAYSVSFSAVGGQPPYTWSLSPGSPGLPPGLTLSAGGLLSGTPTQAATFDFSVRLTDAGGRTVDRPYSIVIDP